MKKRAIVLGFLLLAALLFSSCGTSSKTSNSTTTLPTTSTSGGSVVLTVAKGTTIKTYTLTELQALPPTNGIGGTLLSGVTPCQGVAVIDLLNAVGGITEGESVTISAAHSYSKTITYDQLTNSSYNFYDVNGNTVTPTTKPVLAAIYSVNGVSLEPDTVHGPVQLGILTNQNLATDAAFWLDNIQKIEIISTP
jgi:hypothetical protein